ncbi:MAG TPA: DUF4198 domain-containing protein [Thermoanaerobaculia bacterium]
MKRAAPLLIGFLAAAPLLGHDTWIVPDHFLVHRGERIALHMTSGMEFPKLDFAIKPDRVARAFVRVGKRSRKMTPIGAAHSLDFRIPMRTAGVATIAVDLEPKSIELTPTQVTEYLDEIGADADLHRLWSESPEPKRWREIYTKHAKSFVVVAKADDSWKEPAGLTLEFMPLEDPTSLRVGNTLPIRLIESGKPLANFSIGVVYEGDRQGTILKTDGDGRATISLPRSGRYMLRATHIRPAHRPDADWISDFTTLTVNVR